HVARTRRKSWAGASCPRCSRRVLSRRRQSLLEIGDDVVLVLQPDREANDVGSRTSLDLLRVRELTVSGRGRMNDERTRVPDIGEMRKQLYVGYEPDARVIAAFEPEREAGARALGHVLLREIVITIAEQLRITPPRHLALIGKPLRHRQSIVAVSLHAQRQRLDAREDEKGVEWRQRRPDVAQGQHTAGDGEGEIAEGLVQHD